MITYLKKTDPRWWMLLLFILTILIVNHCNAQFMELSQNNDACGTYEDCYVILDFDQPVNSLSLELYWNASYYDLEVLGITDALITPQASYIWDTNVIQGRRHLTISWFDIYNSISDDTLFCITLKRLTSWHNVNIYWNLNKCEITDNNAVAYPITWIDGWLRCFTTGVEGATKGATEGAKKYYQNGKIIIEVNGKKYNINGGGI